MLFVAPYNAQVTRLQQALGEQARVSSVGRFQGQEAPIVFLSLCSSEEAASPRGLSFLFDRNQLNVAVSRAETMCVVAGHMITLVGTRYKVTFYKEGNFGELLDLQEDLQEVHNLWDDPDSDNVKKNMLQALLQAVLTEEPMTQQIVAHA